MQKQFKCFVKPQENVMYFADTRIPLHYIHSGQVQVIKGDKQSLGHQRSNVDFDFRSTKCL